MHKFFNICQKEFWYLFKTVKKELIEIVEDELISRISIDWENISFGALNRWSKLGIENAFLNMIKEAEIIEKKERHEEIVSEIIGIWESL